MKGDEAKLEWLRKRTFLGFVDQPHVRQALPAEVRRTLESSESVGTVENFTLFPAENMLSIATARLHFKTRGLESLRIWIRIPKDETEFPFKSTKEITQLFPASKGTIAMEKIAAEIPELTYDHDDGEWQVQINGSRFRRFVLVRPLRKGTFDVSNCSFHHFEERGDGFNQAIRMNSCKAEYLFLTSLDVTLRNVSEIQLISQPNPPKPGEDRWKIENCDFATKLGSYRNTARTSRKGWQWLPTYAIFYFAPPESGPGEPRNNIADRRTQSNVLATMLRIKDDFGYEYYSSRFAQLFAYLDSRSSIWKRILFWLHGGYSFIFRPFLCAMVMLGLGATLVHAQSTESPFVLALDLKKSLERIILKDIYFDQGLRFEDWRRLALLGCQLALYYFSFCFGLAIKRRWGFPKHQP